MKIKSGKLIKNFLNLKMMVLLVFFLLPMLAGCSQAILKKSPQIPKPSAPSLESVSITRDLYCNKIEDENLCKIIRNFKNLLKYVCKLESAPFWESSSESLCNLDEDKNNILQDPAPVNKDIILSLFAKIQKQKQVHLNELN